MMTLGEKIQKLRSMKGWSQEQLAEHITVSRQSVSKWELNQSIPDVEYIKQMSALFSVSLDYLLNEDCTETSQSTVQMQPEKQPPMLKTVVRAGVVMTDVLMTMAAVLMYCFGVVLTVFGACCAFAGLCLITTLDVTDLIPYMPYLPALLLGLVLIALACGVGIAVKWYFIAISRLCGRYFQNSRMLWRGKQEAEISEKRSGKNIVKPREKKLFCMFLGIFAILILAWFVTAFLYTGLEAPWHYWNWF